MGIFDRFPYSSTHEMNLDFMLGKATEIAEDMQTVATGMAQVQAGLSAISEKTEQATQAAAQAAASASSIEGSVATAEEAAEEAQRHNESAQTWANNALTYKADCQRAATEAAASSSSAAQAATAAAASEDTVATYAQAANASAQSAANNNDSAHQYANQASASASNATFHSSNAQTAATNAQTAATNAQTAADRAASLKTDVETLHRMCTAAVDQAATEAVNAANSAAQAAATKTDVETLVESLPEDFTDLNNTVNQLSDEIDNIISDANSQDLWVQKSISTMGVLQDNTYWISTSDYIPDSAPGAEIVKDGFAMRVFGYKSDDTCLYCWNGSEFAYGYTNTTKFSIAEIQAVQPLAVKFRIGLVKTSGAAVALTDYDAVSMKNTNFYTKSEANAMLASVKNAIDTVYIATDGSDSNDGTLEHPFATVDHALQVGASSVCVKGGIYDQRINIAKLIRKSLRLTAYNPLERTIFRLPNSLITETETLVSGYTKVYSATTQRALHTQISRIFQDGIPDATTLIDKSERHPLQRGYFYRCEDTKIYRTNATTLADALTEIENSEQYKYFVDSGTVYFSRPAPVTAENPIRASQYYDNELFYNCDKGISLEVSGIETKYMCFNVSNTVNAVISDCKSANGYLDGFKYNAALNATFIRCESCNASTETLGDGFSSAGDPDNEFAKGSTVTLIDCWAHDNTDDGFSDHKGCETTIYGGLFEYNGKAGITPTGGDHCTCYNVLSRRNFCGFLYGGSSEKSQAGDGMNGGQLVCYNCVAEHNIYGTDQNNAGFFLSGYMNTAMLVNCKSIGNKVGYYGRSLTLEGNQGYDPTEGIGSMVLIDCGALDNTQAAIQNPESMEFKNTTVVSAN